MGKLQGHGSLFPVADARVQIHKGERLGRAAQGILQQLGQLVIPVRDVPVPSGDGRDDIAQRTERLVDLDGLSQPVSGDLGALDALRTRQVAEQELARLLRARDARSGVHLHDEQHMRARALHVHVRVAGMPLPDAQADEALDLLRGGDHLLGQVLHTHLARRQVPDLQVLLLALVLACEQVDQAVAVELHHAQRDLIIIALLIPSDNGEHFVRRPRAKALLDGFINKVISAPLWRQAVHCERLAGARLAVSEDGNVKTVHRGLHQVAHAVEDLLLGTGGPDAVEGHGRGAAGRAGKGWLRRKTVL
mmetsp:Transcript_30868/g.89849  ORF Transcript_30868/g.89849 Transcript_30868/m.89849 type:complete len:306 (-) Transcript_30868:1807-2724(-)